MSGEEPSDTEIAAATEAIMDHALSAVYELSPGGGTQVLDACSRCGSARSCLSNPNRGGAVNRNHWHGDGCQPGACRHGCPQCPECGSCRSTTNPPGDGHDDGCTRAVRELESFRQRLATRARKPSHIKRPAGAPIPIRENPTAAGPLPVDAEARDG